MQAIVKGALQMIISVEMIEEPEKMKEKETKDKTQEVKVKLLIAVKEALEKGVVTEEEDKKNVKEKKLEVNLEVAALTCQGLTSGGASWSQLGLYWHAPVGVVRSRDCGIELEGC